MMMKLSTLVCLAFASGTLTLTTTTNLNEVQALSIAPPPRQVLVTGASGKTGRLVFEALQQQQPQGRFQPLALVRSEASAKSLRQMVPSTGLDQVVIGDVTQPLDPSQPALQGCDSMVICTSAMPVISKRSLAKALLKAPLNLVRGKKLVDFKTLRFGWKGGQYPELVDYHGQVAQIDFAKQLGIRHVVVVGSMGGTDPNNFLNRIGKRADGSGHGDILLWKRKAEQYLIESGLDYTIIHPGGLTDQVGEHPPKELVLDVDDKLIARAQKSIARADVAQLCVAALTVGQGQKVALDVVSQDFVSTTDNSSSDDEESCPTAEQALEAFLSEKKVYTYA